MLVGLFQAILSDIVTEVNARAVAAARGIDLTESSSTRARSFRSLLSVKLMTSEGERWVEGTVDGASPRLVLLNGVPIEAPLGGTLLLIANHDQPGVIGEVGTILGRHGINIANFALGTKCRRRRRCGECRRARREDRRRRADSYTRREGCKSRVVGARLKS